MLHTEPIPEGNTSLNEIRRFVSQYRNPIWASAVVSFELIPINTSLHVLLECYFSALFWWCIKSEVASNTVWVMKPPPPYEATSPAAPPVQTPPSRTTPTEPRNYGSNGTQVKIQSVTCHSTDSVSQITSYSPLLYWFSPLKELMKAREWIQTMSVPEGLQLLHGFCCLITIWNVATKRFILNSVLETSIHKP